MKMDVEILSQETIKPLFPTPDDHRRYNLSRLDQTVIPYEYIPIVLFYPNDDPTPKSTHHVIETKINTLKKSLSETLTRFFPLAGTISEDELSVDCDDRGASFTTARLDCSLIEFLRDENLNLKSIGPLFPPSAGNISPESKTNHLVYVQATVFDKCGGITIGAFISHLFLDGTSFSFFLRSWADVNAAANSSKLEEGQLHDDDVISPDFSTASSLFPAGDLQVKEALLTSLMGSKLKEGQAVTRRFVFDGSAINALKEKARPNSNCTRVEAVSAFIWKSAIAAFQQTSSGRSTVARHPVNLRKRAVPNFSQRSIGNPVWSARTEITAQERDQIGFSELVDEVRKSISEIDGDFVKKLQGDGGPSIMARYIEVFVNDPCCIDMDYFYFNSWCKMGFYETDFGWGKPAWVSCRDGSGPFCLNITVLMDTKCGKGIEAWITFDERLMAVLERDQEFRAFARFNPSPLRCAADD